MKPLLIVLLFCIICRTGHSQTAVIDSYKDSVNKAVNDSDQARFLYILSYYYQNYKPDSALLLAEASYNISKEINFIKGETSSLGQMALAFNRLGNFTKALEMYLEQLQILE